MFLSEKVFDWFSYAESHQALDESFKNRAYELFERSEILLERDMTFDARSECILSLKRTINHRLKTIEKIYSLRSIGLPNKPNGYLELLELCGLVRPLFLKKLMKIRNSIEHEDTNPPSYKECREFLDVVWYFLKSTDGLVSNKPTEVMFSKSKPIESNLNVSLI